MITGVGAELEFYLSLIGLGAGLVITGVVFYWWLRSK